MIDSFDEFAVFNSALVTDRDIQSEYLFYMCSIATNMVTLLEFNAIRCATMRCHFGRTRKVT